MLLAPFVPGCQEKRIEREMCALERSGDGFERRLLPAAAGLAVLEHFIAADQAVGIELECLALRCAALNTRAVLQYDHQVTAMGPSAIRSCTTPCCARIAAG